MIKRVKSGLRSCVLEISPWTMDDAPRLDRPVEVDSDQIETIIENNQLYTTWEIAGILKISNQALNIISTSLVM